MVAPIFKKVTDPNTDPTSAKYGAPDIKHAFDVMDGTHATQRLQQIYIEGSKPLFGYDAIVKEQPLGSRDYYAYAANTGSLIASSTVAGSADAAAVINAAITHIGSGTVFVRNGFYDFRTTLFVPDNTSIIGESRFETIFHSTADMGPDEDATQIMNSNRVDGNKNIVLANFTSDHKDSSSANWGEQDLAIITGGACMNLRKVHESIVFNCRIKDGKKFTLFWASVGASTPESNRNNIFSHNIVEQTQVPKSGTDAFGGGNLIDFLVVDNIFRNCYGSAQMAITHPQNLTIANNTFRDGQSTGVSIEGGVNCHIVNNIIRNNGHAGIKFVLKTDPPGFCHDNIVAGNVVFGNGLEGLQGRPESHHNIVVNNIFYNNGGPGIHFGTDSNNNLIAGNICINNGTDTTDTEHGRAGIRMQNITMSLLANNICMDTRSSGKTQQWGVSNVDALSGGGGGTGDSLYINNYLTGNNVGAIAYTGTSATTAAGRERDHIRYNEGYNRVTGEGGRTAVITVGASPFTHTNTSRVPKMIYLKGGGVSEVRKDGVVCFTSSNVDLWLEPNEAVVVEYSGTTPVMVEDRK